MGLDGLHDHGPNSPAPELDEYSTGACAELAPRELGALLDAGEALAAAARTGAAGSGAGVGSNSDGAGDAGGAAVLVGWLTGGATMRRSDKDGAGGACVMAVAAGVACTFAVRRTGSCRLVSAARSARSRVTVRSTVAYPPPAAAAADAATAATLPPVAASIAACALVTSAPPARESRRRSLRRRACTCC